jgi:hypothetical protein
MKKFLSILFLFVYFSGFSQTKLDSLVFERINEYRIESGVPALMWGSDMYKVSNHHALYLLNMISPLVGKPEILKILKYLWSSGDNGELRWHLEDTIVGNFVDTLKTVDDRILKFTTSFSEDSVKLSNENVLENAHVGIDLEKGAIDIVNFWIKSKDHNENLLEPSSKYGSVSVVYMDEDYIIAVFNSYGIAYFPKCGKKYEKLDLNEIIKKN